MFVSCRIHPPGMKKFFPSLEISVFCLTFFVLFPVCISYKIQDPFVTPRLIAASAALVLLCVILLAKKYHRHEIPSYHPWIPYSFLAFLLLYLLSLVQSLNPGDALIEWMKAF